jgi:hypothetical protein
METKVGEAGGEGRTIVKAYAPKRMEELGMREKTKRGEEGEEEEGEGEGGRETQNVWVSMMATT